MNTRLCDLWEGEDQGPLRASLGPNANQKRHTILGMQPGRASWPVSGAGWDCSLLTPPPGDLVQDKTCTNLRAALGRFVY